ncbi:unnamed protein product [Closterium sp. NIES-53]
MHNGASRANRLRASASVRTAVFNRATLDSRSAAALAHRRPAVLACRLSAVLARLLYATLAGGRPCCAHRTAQALYDAVVARYSSPATTALGRLLLPYLFPELSTFATVEDLVTHLRSSDARYRIALPSPPSRGFRDYFLALDPTALTVDLLEQHLLASETSVVAAGAVRGTPRTPIFEGCSPSPLAPSYASAAAVDVPGAEDVGAASASGKRRSSKGKGGRGGSAAVIPQCGVTLARNFPSRLSFHFRALFQIRVPAARHPAKPSGKQQNQDSGWVPAHFGVP